MTDHAEHFSMADHRAQTEQDRVFAAEMSSYATRSLGTAMDKLRHFTKFVPRQTLSHFLAKHSLFEHIVNVHGHIIECGVYLGGGLMTWAQFSAIYEPFNHIRRIVGFDTFTGFPKIGNQDIGDNTEYTSAGGLATHAADDIREAMRLYDINRPIGHIPRVELIAGDGTITMPQYVNGNKHLVVALLYLDFDLYEPTRIAIETFLPRMPKGAVLVFDELNQKQWPGETLAVLETIGIRNLRIRRFSYTPQLSYAILE